MKTTSYDRFVLLTGLMPDVLARDFLAKKQVIEGVQLSPEDYRYVVESVDTKLRSLHATNPTFRNKMKNSAWTERWVEKCIDSFLENKNEYKNSSFLTTA
jgi:hypothetical protein